MALWCQDSRNDSTNASGMHQKPGRNHTAEPTCCTLKHLTTILQWILNPGFKLPCLSGEFAFPLMDDRFTPSRLASTIPTPTSSELCHLTSSSCPRDEGAEGKLRTKQKLAPYTLSPCHMCNIPHALLAALKEKRCLTDRDPSPAGQESPSIYKCPSDLQGRKKLSHQ